MTFKRKQSIEQSFYPGRVLIIYGPRRVGKTTMLQEYLATQTEKKIFSVVGDDAYIRELFERGYLAELKDFAAPYDIIAIDEAQQIPSIGLGAKMLIDAFPEKQILLTGSSSFELAGQIGEPLTGRHFTLTLLPLAQTEIYPNAFESRQYLEKSLIYGAYPEVLLTNDVHTKQSILSEIVSSYLYKDILVLDKIKSPRLLRDIAKMIALQIGHEVSLNEIAVSLNSDVKTVARYLDLLEKMFVIKCVRGFSRNLRNEISKKARYYFLDNGVRNAVIGQFSPLDSRNDVGALWENFIFTEFLKHDSITKTHSDFYFWRTHTGAEIDIIREHNGAIHAYECKWSTLKKVKAPNTFTSAYPEAEFSVITPDTYFDFLVD